MSGGSEHIESTDRPVYPALARAGTGEEPGRPHVYLLCDRASWERIGPITRRLAVGLVDEAVRVSLICDDDCPASLALPGLQGTHNLHKHSYLDLWRPRRRYEGLPEFAQQNRPTCIHAVSLSCLETALEMRQVLQVPVLVNVDAATGPCLDLLVEALGDGCHAAAMSEQIRAALVARLAERYRPGSIDVVRPGVHVQPRSRPPFEPGAPISLLVLEPVTRTAGMEAMLKAVAQLLQNRIDVMLFFIDSGPAETHLRKVAQQLQVHEHITFTGKFIRWPQTLGAADVVILPRPQTQMQVYPLEAMASATLVVAAAGHCYDAIVDGRTAVEFHPQRDDDLAIRLVAALQDAQQARTLAYTAQEKVRRDHSVSQMINGYISLYERLGRVEVRG